MGQFHLPGKLTGPTGVSEIVSLLVDTGATTGGREEVWPLASVQIELEGHEVPTPGLIAPDWPPLLNLVLAVDPVAKRLRPFKACVLEQRAHTETVLA